MKLTLRQTLKLITIFTIIMSAMLFIIFNFNLFYNKKRLLPNQKIACQNLNPNDPCSFLSANQPTPGHCLSVKHGPLICQPLK